MGHPQCLDYGPPFQPPFHLKFCFAYEKFGCCDQERDNSISAKYWDIMDYIDPREHKLCGRYIKDILCQIAGLGAGLCSQLKETKNVFKDIGRFRTALRRDLDCKSFVHNQGVSQLQPQVGMRELPRTCKECSSYAAHIYDAEKPPTPLRSLPGLCFEYCSKFHFNCCSAISLLTSDRHIQECCGTNKMCFCDHRHLHDEDYCFLNVLKNTALNHNLGSVVVDCKGCLQFCLTEVANGLRNPMLMVHANDHTHSLFVAE